MLERELKFHIPPARRASIKHAMGTLNAQLMPLHALYFDTEHSELANAHIALRVRREGQQWVQTIKMPGPDEVTRIELNHDRPEPSLDLSVYQDTVVGDALAALEQPLTLRYETDIQRLVATIDCGDGKVELAYDVGHIAAANTRLAVCELELEQIGGGIPELFSLARQWQARHGLILDYRSKAERGNALATHKSLLAPYQMMGFAADVDNNTPPARIRVANGYLALAVRNACLLAAASDSDMTDSLTAACREQLNIGVRGLQSYWPTALQEHGAPSSDTPGSTGFQAELLNVLEALVQAAEDYSPSKAAANSRATKG